MISLDLFYHNLHVLLILPNRDKENICSSCSWHSLLDAWRFLMSLITFPRMKTPFLLACPPSSDWVRLCWFMLFPSGGSHFDPCLSWISLCRSSTQRVPSWGLINMMQNGRSTWCVLQSSLLFIHFSVTFTVTEDFFVCFLLPTYVAVFVKVKATTWNQTATEAPEMLSINRNSFLLCTSVSVKSHCIWIAICCEQLNWDLDEL